MKKLLFLVLALLLLASCSFESKTMVLSSDVGSEIYLIEKDAGIVLSFNEGFQTKLSSISGLDREKLLMDLFPEAAVFKTVENENYKKRQELLYLLNDATEADNSLESFTENRKVLKDSKLIAELDAMTDGFDSALLDATEKACGKYRVYNVDRIFHGEYDYEGAKSFLNDWIDSIKR
ncbi:MAG: hypothetical protein II339_05165 [Spirochaetales bacterium]|nr:hypothetical protein [Spirochaetales bacterium]